MYVSNSYANAEVTVTIFTGQVRAFCHAQHRHRRFKTPKGLYQGNREGQVALSLVPDENLTGNKCKVNWKTV